MTSARASSAAAPAQMDGQTLGRQVDEGAGGAGIARGVFVEGAGQRGFEQIEQGFVRRAYPGPAEASSVSSRGSKVSRLVVPRVKDVTRTGPGRKRDQIEAHGHLLQTGAVGGQGQAGAGEGAGAVRGSTHSRAGVESARCLTSTTARTLALDAPAGRSRQPAVRRRNPEDAVALDASASSGGGPDSARRPECARPAPRSLAGLVHFLSFRAEGPAVEIAAGQAQGPGHFGGRFAGGQAGQGFGQGRIGIGGRWKARPPRPVRRRRRSRPWARRSADRRQGRSRGPRANRLIELGQFTADGVRAGARRWRPCRPGWRPGEGRFLRRRSRSARKDARSSQEGARARPADLGGGKPANRKRSVGRPATVSAASTDDAPGIGTRRVWPAAMAVRGDTIAGVGDQGRAGVGDQGDPLRRSPRLRQTWATLGGEVVVVLELALENDRRPAAVGDAGCPRPGSGRRRPGRRGPAG